MSLVYACLNCCLTILLRNIRHFRSHEAWNHTENARQSATVGKRCPHIKKSPWSLGLEGWFPSGKLGAHFLIVVEFKISTFMLGKVKGLKRWAWSVESWNRCKSMQKYSKYSPPRSHENCWTLTADDLECEEDKPEETKKMIDNTVPCRKLAYHTLKLSNAY